MFSGDLKLPYGVLFIIYEVWGSPGSIRSQNRLKIAEKRPGTGDWRSGSTPVGEWRLAKTPVPLWR